MTAMASEPLSAYLPLLVEGRPQAFVGLFGRDPVIEDPRAGRVAGVEAVEAFAAATADWLDERDARLVPGRTTRGGTRTVVESVLVLDDGDGGHVDLPVALVADRHGDRLGTVRVYHSLWPIEGAHRVRPPLLPERADLVLPKVVRDYQTALAAGDLDAILELFEPDGYAREPSGGRHLHRGPEELARFYGGLLEAGGLPLEHCTATDDGTCTALEYNVVARGDQVLEPQAGVACYERGRSGRLVAARVYDDVEI
jgi:SnoaL-like domain